MSIVSKESIISMLMVKRVNAEKEEAVEMFCKKYPQIPASAFTAFSLYMTDPHSVKDYETKKCFSRTN